MPFILEPLLQSDVPRSVNIYFAAFQNPHSLACWPRTTSIRAWWENMIREELSETGAHWLSAIDTETGKVAAFAKWVQPSRSGELPSLDLPEWPKEADEALCNDTFGAWARKRREVVAGRPHWYLEIVGTHPSYQGQGAATKLIRWGLDQADEAGIEAYLDASPEAVPFYLRHGFVEVDRVDTLIDNERVTETWYRELFMLRQPTAKPDKATTEDVYI